MAKFSSSTRTAQKSPITTVAPAYTHEGGQGFSRDPKSELFLLALTNMVQEQTFYEGSNERDERFRFLIHEVTGQDPEWVQRFIPYLRNTMQMRSASVVLATEYVKAGGPNGRQVVNSALSRADEPAEILGYWTQFYGRAIPKPLKRGVADAVVRLYNERSALKYDGQSRGWRMGDVIELTHPKPNGNSELLKYLLDVRHHPENANPDESLKFIREAKELESLPVEQRRPRLTEAGRVMGWERLSGWLQGPMDKEAWEAVIPNMGYMALLRNLRNFDEVEISDEAAQSIKAKLTDPEQIRKSRQFPIRFLSAWTATQSMRWGETLEKALELSVQSVPSLPGRTLIMVDCSGSMADSLSQRTQVQRWMVAGVFGTALAKQAESADVYGYNTSSWKVEVPKSTSILKLVPQHFGARGGTYTMQVLQSLYKDHDRVVILTDEQDHDTYEGGIQAPIYTFNLAGYRVGHLPSGLGNTHTFGGLTDAGFILLKILDETQSVGWPF